MSNDISTYDGQPSSDERIMAMLMYLLSFITTIIAPLIIWVIKKDESKFINFHGKQYFNFVISYFIYGIVAYILTIALIGFALIPIFFVLSLIFIIVAAVKAYNGEMYVIPLTIRFIK
ncbi:DUF4870 domain-containing protein [Alkalicoccobacillus murimartini]|uniref:Tic20 family protein n=1 Tax=Alkalicoccobacillus murimartini TaxID=171685 RepID=A0ABT9YDV1_9BACI|nr:DUF4870 domain-containing protein [Alkalicoccobacillus murimartini]MDQ0206032.1 putative Tic20 family protein [Alkalicoccobacillus murimartini]